MNNKSLDLFNSSHAEFQQVFVPHFWMGDVFDVNNYSLCYICIFYESISNLIILRLQPES